MGSLILNAPRSDAPVFDPNRPGYFSSYWIRQLNALYSATLANGQAAALLQLLGDPQIPDDDDTGNSGSTSDLSLFGLFDSAPSPLQAATLDQTLTAASTTIHAPGTGGNLLVVILRQDVTGGRAITWGAEFSAVGTSLGQALPSTLCAFLFALSNDKWVLVAEGPKDMTP